MQVHPATGIFPMLDGAQLEALADDIKENGLRESIKTFEGQILDGRNRLAACKLAGVEPQFEDVGDIGDPVSYVVSLNLHRRHLNESQRAMVAEKVANYDQGRPQKTPKSGGLKTSIPQAAEMLGVGRGSVESARKVRNDGAPGLPEMVERAQVPVSVAAKVAALPMAEQVAAVAAGPEAVREAAKPHVTHNSGNNEWYTPVDFIARARQAMGSIDLDPASSEEANEVVGATEYYTAEMDGLSREWNGNVWLNPPYASGLVDRFVDHLIDELDAARVMRAIVLVNNATETKWFQKLLAASIFVCFPAGRVRFWKPGTAEVGAPLQGQAILYCRNQSVMARSDGFILAFGDIGTVLFNDEP